MTGSDPSATPPRVRVVLAQRRGARRVRTRRELVEQTELGEALVDGLIRAQLGLALRVASVSVLVLGALPVLLRIEAVASLSVFGLRLPWLLLGVVVYPALYAVGRLAVRLAERNDQDFGDLAQD